MDKYGEYVVGVELGGQWISCLVASVENGELNVLGWGREPAEGFRRGELVDLDAACACIEAAIHAAEESAMVNVQTVFIGAGSSHYRGLNSRGCVPILREDRLVTEETRRKVVQAAEGVSLPNEREVLDVNVQTFTVDDMRWVENPVGMTGARLEAEVHLATDAASYLNNIAVAVDRANCQAEGIVSKPVAVGRAALSKDEKRLGALAIDIGASCTSISLFRGGSACFSAVLSVGGRHVTHDIAMCLNISVEEAEEIKKTHARACRSALDLDEQNGTFQAHTPGGSVQTISTGRLHPIVWCRQEELFTIVKKELARSGYGESYHGGVVLAGGGAKVAGIEDVARRVFNCAVRVGRPHEKSRMGEQLEDASWAACVGVLQCGLEQRRASGSENPARQGTFRRILTKSLDWARAAF